MICNALTTLSSKEALEKLAEKHRPKGKAEDVEGFKKLRLESRDIEIELSLVASAFDLSPGELKKRKRNFLPRQAAYYHLVENCEVTVTAVSDLMGITQPAVSFGISKIKGDLRKNKDLRKRLEVLHE